MKSYHFAILALSLMLLFSLEALRRSVAEGERLASNQRALISENQSLRAASPARQKSAERMRMTAGEFDEFRTQSARRVESLGVKIRHLRSVTLAESIQQLDTLTTTSSLCPSILSDSLCRVRWRDSWVSLDVEVRPEASRLRLTSCDTLFQVVHRVPWRWWIFSWGTKAIRQEITSSNPHTRLVYAEYIEIE